MTRPLLLLALLTVLAGPGRADAPTPVSLPQSHPKTPLRYEFGTVDPVRRPQVSHVFLLRNDGPAPLTLGELDPSCRCTTATVETSGGDPPTLAPGGQVAVRVAITFESLLRGPLTKDVWVYAQGGDQPIAVLELSGVLRRPVAARPQPRLSREPGGLVSRR